MSRFGMISFSGIGWLLTVGIATTTWADDAAIPVPDLPQDLVADYVLTFQDEFEGEQLNLKRWQHRSVGRREMGYVVPEASTLDGEGHLQITLTKQDDRYLIGQVGTQNSFSQRYGYFECRARLNSKKGPHTAFWLQSPILGQGLNDTARYGTEIDIFEYLTTPDDQVIHHNLHWNGYGEHHRSTGRKRRIPGIKHGWHTFGLLWTEDYYEFFVDGNSTWDTERAVSQIPQYLILSLELTGWGGQPDDSTLPDRILFDYVRVWQHTDNLSKP